MTRRPHTMAHFPRLGRPMAESRHVVTASAGPAPAAATFSRERSARGAFSLNAAFVVGLLVLSQLPLLDARPVVRTSIVGVAVLLLAWSTLLFGVLRRGQRVTLEVVLRRQHYLQACQQGVVLLVWGYYWREVYHAVPLIVAQLLFAYGFDSLLSWTHRRKFVLGFGSFPIIFSITLFFWFKDPWFYWQFAMVALGLAAKEFLRWQRDGVNTHIFNPSSLPLAVAGLALLLAGASDMTWGFLVAETQFYPPHMYLLIFLVALPGQYLFGVTTMTMSAVVTTFAFSAVYHAATGSFYFVDSHVPIPGFLRQVAASAAAESVRRATRPRGSVAEAEAHRSVEVGTSVGAAPPASRLHGRVGGRVRRDERVRLSRRPASRAMDAVLGAGLRRRQARRLPEFVFPARRLLHGWLRVVVQRDRHLARGALRQSRERRRGVQPRLQAAIRGGLR